MIEELLRYTRQDGDTIRVELRSMPTFLTIPADTFDPVLSRGHVIPYEDLLLEFSSAKDKHTYQISGPVTNMEIAEFRSLGQTLQPAARKRASLSDLETSATKSLPHLGMCPILEDYNPPGETDWYN